MKNEEDNKTNFTISSKSLMTYEDSHQSVAQEFKYNESIQTLGGIGGTQTTLPNIINGFRNTIVNEDQ